MKLQDLFEDKQTPLNPKDGEAHHHFLKMKMKTFKSFLTEVVFSNGMEHTIIENLKKLAKSTGKFKMTDDFITINGHSFPLNSCKYKSRYLEFKLPIALLEVLCYNGDPYLLILSGTTTTRNLLSSTWTTTRAERIVIDPKTYLKVLLSPEPLTKKNVIKMILTRYKNDIDHLSGPSKRIKEFISTAREAGYDCPELKLIEKSAGLKESIFGEYSHLSKDEALHLLGYITGFDPIDDPKFKDKFIKQLLTYLKRGVHIDYVERMVVLANSAGFDYPELKAIRKSLNSVREDLSPHAQERLDNWVQHLIHSNQLIPTILQIIKNGTYNSHEMHSIKSLISSARNLGYDPPEFKAIEKSLHA